MSFPGTTEQFIFKVSATLELFCFDWEASRVTEVLQVQPTWTTAMHPVASSVLHGPFIGGCHWQYDTASTVSSTKVTDHIQHLLSLFMPIKSRIEEMRPVPTLMIRVHWECSAFGVSGITGPQFTKKD